MAARYVRIGQYPDYRDEIRGTLLEILASTANPGTYAAPEDVAGCALEMGADGLWTGNLGTLTQAQADALVAAGVMGNAKIGVSAQVDRVQCWWSGVDVGWRNGKGGSGWDAWAFVGDSITAVNNGFAPPVSGIIPGPQQGCGVYNSGWSLPAMASLLSFGALRFARNFGFSGLGCATLVAQIPLITSGAWQNFVVQIGTNDLEGTSDQIAQALTNYETFLSAISAVARKVICIGVPPKASKNVGSWNRSQKAICDKFGIPFIPAWTAIADTMTGRPATGMAPDGTHPTFYATTQIAAPILAKFIANSELPMNPIAFPLEASIVPNGLLTEAGTTGCPAGWRQDQAFDSVSIFDPVDKRIAGRVVRWQAADVNAVKNFGTGDFTVVPGQEYEISFYIKMQCSSLLGFKCNLQDGGDAGTTKAFLNFDDVTQAAYQTSTYAIEGIYRSRYVPMTNKLGIRWNVGAPSYASTQLYDITVGQVQCVPC